MKQSRRPSTSHVAVLAVLIAGSILSYLGYYIAREMEYHALHQEQSRLTLLARDVLRSELQVDIARLNSVRGLFLASDYVSRKGFARFIKSEFEEQHSIQAIEWVPRVTRAQREVYRQQAIEDGFTDFDIWQRGPDNERVSATERAEYFPIFYVEPYQDNETILGFDLFSDKQRRPSLLQARKTRREQATASITLLQDKEQQKGFLVAQPVFKRVNGESELKQAPLLGYALGVFSLEDLFDVAIDSVKDQLTPLIFELTDITNSSEPVVLLHSEFTDLSASIDHGKWSNSQSLDFSGRRWLITSHATAEFITRQQSLMLWFIPLVGIVFTLLIAAYLRILIQREIRVRGLVKKRTLELQSSAQLNRTIVENAVDAVITIDSKGIVSRFNPAAVKMFGYSEAEVLGKNVKMLMPDPYHAEHDDYLLHHQQTGEKRIIGIGREVSGRHKNGSVFPIHLSVGEAMDNGNTIYVGTITDLTELKINEQALRDFSNRLELASKAGGIGVWSYDLDTGVLEWDDRMFELYGIDRERYASAHEAWKNALHPDDLALGEVEFNKVMQSKEPFHDEFRIFWPDGQLRYIQVFGEHVVGEKGSGGRMIGVGQDITQRKLSERAMRQAKRAAEEANRQKSAFLNTMSHELRTPLTVILGYLPVLKNSQQMPSPDMIQQIAEDMDISGQHLLEMINDLLDISKVEAGQMTLDIDEIQVLPLLEEMVRKFKYQASKKDIQLLCHAEDFSFRVDQRRLRQILINLIGNALKFTERGQITVSADFDDDYVTFSVTDTGIGIDEQEIPLLFNTFHQVDNSSTRKAGGSGLGLAITKRLVELHGGTIQITSKPGEGSSFTFTIKQ